MLDVIHLTKTYSLRSETNNDLVLINSLPNDKILD